MRSCLSLPDSCARSVLRFAPARIRPHTASSRSVDGTRRKVTSPIARLADCSAQTSITYLVNPFQGSSHITGPMSVPINHWRGQTWTTATSAASSNPISTGDPYVHHGVPYFVFDGTYTVVSGFATDPGVSPCAVNRVGRTIVQATLWTSPGRRPPSPAGTGRAVTWSPMRVSCFFTSRGKALGAA